MYIQNIIIKWGMYVRRFSGYLKYIPLYTKSWKYLEPNCPQASETTDIPAFYRLLHPPCLCTTSTSVVLPIISRHLQRNSTHYSLVPVEAGVYQRIQFFPAPWGCLFTGSWTPAPIPPSSSIFARWQHHYAIALTAQNGLCLLLFSPLYPQPLLDAPNPLGSPAAFPEAQW